MPLNPPLIHSPNPIVMTITVNESTGAIRSDINRVIPHAQAVIILLQVALGHMQESLSMGAAVPKNPANNPGGNPGGNNLAV